MLMSYEGTYTNVVRGTRQLRDHTWTDMASVEIDGDDAHAFGKLKTES